MAEAPEAPNAATSKPIHVYKFGGTSVATPERIREVVHLVDLAPPSTRIVVVVSALGGVTDELIRAIDAALSRTEEHTAILSELKDRHHRVLGELMPAGEQQEILQHLDALWKDLEELLYGVYLMRECTARSRDAILSMGERASAPIVAGAFRASGAPSVAVEASRLIRTDDRFGEATVDFNATRTLVQQVMNALPDEAVPVVTGFIASTEDGVVTTLGRSGSDYTATILADALDAEEVIIWTDVDGVLSADPRLVTEAFPLEQLNYREAAELAYFGAKVLHPRTMLPVQARGIPLLIKNTMNPEATGTVISSETAHMEGHVKAVTSIQGMSLITLEGSGMIGVPGIAARAFQALASQKVNVFMFSQASSEQSICFIVRQDDQQKAVKGLEDAFALERSRGDVSTIMARPEITAVAVVGENLRSRPGIAGRMFNTLGRAGINVIAIAQGSSERNISVAIAEEDTKRAVSALHEAFSRAHNRAHVCLIGVGTIGGMLLRMLTEHAPNLLENLNLNLRLVAVADVKRMVWNEEGVSLDAALDRLASGEPSNLQQLVHRLTRSRLERLIVVDATASDEVARIYPELLRSNIAVVTPNKRANTQELSFFLQLQRASRRRRIPFLYETNVGAGLPVISTLRDLLMAGDRIKKIEGVFSGTLGFVFHSLQDGKTFSEAVRTASKKGYTEPDPRDDLAGEDVARKLMILAREMGLPVERSDVNVESLVPSHLLHVSTSEFLDRLNEVDEEWKERVETHRKRGERLRFVGDIENGMLKVGVKPVPSDSPLGGLRGTDNLIAFYTEYYNTAPLVVQGAGAGPEVTAAGVLADVIRAAELMS